MYCLCVYFGPFKKNALVRTRRKTFRTKRNRHIFRLYLQSFYSGRVRSERIGYTKRDNGIKLGVQLPFVVPWTHTSGLLFRLDVIDLWVVRYFTQLNKTYCHRCPMPILFWPSGLVIVQLDRVRSLGYTLFRCDRWRSRIRGRGTTTRGKRRRSIGTSLTKWIVSSKSL